jgi:hypothetical protein
VVTLLLSYPVCAPYQDTPVTLTAIERMPSALTVCQRLLALQLLHLRTVAALVAATSRVRFIVRQAKASNGTRTRLVTV